MRVAVTERHTLDNSPLEIHVQQREWNQMPALGVTVCAYGPDGWTYIGPVVSVDAEAHFYTIKPVAANKRIDNIKAWHGAVSGSGQAIPNLWDDSRRESPGAKGH